MKTTCLLLVLIFLVKAEAFASCGDINFQWIPDTAKLGIPIEGVLSVTREATSTVQCTNVQYTHTCFTIYF